MSKKQGFKLVIKTGADTEEEREKDMEGEAGGKREKTSQGKKCAYMQKNRVGRKKTNFNKSEVE